MFEMLVGYPPFYSDDPMTTCRKVKTEIHLIFFMFSLLEISAVFCIDLFSTTVVMCRVQHGAFVGPYASC